MKVSEKSSLHLIVFLLIVLLAVRFTGSFTNTLSWDVKGYYLYLPALFIYNDPQIADISWVEQIQDTYQTSSTLYMLNPAPAGGQIIKYTCGMAFFYAPFFFVGHTAALLHPSFPADGFSMPYQYAISLGIFLYIFIGLWFLRKILLRYFDARTTLLTLTILILGTNAFNQFAFQNLQAHTPLFVLYAMLIWATIRFYDGIGVVENGRSGITISVKRLILVGLLCGFITLLRPTEIVCVALFGLWNVDSKRAFVNRVLLFMKNPHWVLIIVILAGIVMFPQMLYWHSLTGNWLHYSYNNPGEGLDFLSPYIYPFLFSFRKGWLVYTPLMVLAVSGLFFLFRQHKGLVLPISVFSLLSLYLMSAWTTWWYAGGCFSARTMLSVYPALAIPLGAMVSFLWKNRRYPAGMFAWAVIVFLIFLNLFQTWQFQQGIITRETMTKAYYFRSFLACNVSDQDRRLLLVTRPLTAIEFFEDEQHYMPRELFHDAYRQSDHPAFRFADMSDNGTVEAMILDSLSPYSPVRTFGFHELTVKDHVWLRGKARVFIPAAYDEADPLLVMSFLHEGQHYKYRSTEGRPLHIVAGQWNVIEIEYITPEVRSPDDILQVYVWHRGKHPVYLESLNVDVFERL